MACFNGICIPSIAGGIAKMSSSSGNDVVSYVRTKIGLGCRNFFGAEEKTLREESLDELFQSQVKKKKLLDVKKIICFRVCCAATLRFVNGLRL